MVDVSKIKAIYPAEAWEITETEFNVDNNYRGETIFSLSNGFIGTRGTYEEAYAFSKDKGLEGSFINGLYESQKIRYGELAFAYPEVTQTMLNVTNAKIIKLFVDDEEFSMLEGEISDYSRTLDMKNGLVTRNVVWTTKTGKRLSVKTERLISLKTKNLMAVNYEVTPLNFSGEISFASFADGNVENSTDYTNARIDYGPYGKVLLTEEIGEKDGIFSILKRTEGTKLPLICSFEDCFFGCDIISRETQTCSDAIGERVTVAVKENETASLCKYICYATEWETDPFDTAKAVIDSAKAKGFKALKDEQAEILNELWLNCDIKIDGNVALQQGLRFNMFQLMQSACRDGKGSIGAKGLSGEGYEGHIFWDTEMYCLPFFIFTNPEIAKKLLKFRFNTLDRARNRARELSIDKGACFPWRTINGNEASAYYPAGTAQFHINADIAFAVQKYIDATGDMDYLKTEGAELLIEIARFWYDFGAFIKTKGNKFCINCVTGPDEFSVLVDNNCYTNLLVRECFKNAFAAANYLKDNEPKVFAELCAKIGMDEKEPADWKNAADNMYIPYDEETGIYPQDDSFMGREPLVKEEIPPEKFPLLNNHHPLVVYRYQISKQADFILSMFLLSHMFSLEEKKVNFDFYDRVTLHESSLSACIFSAVASEIGYKEKALTYFNTTSRLDLDDYHNDTKAGIHTANMAGTWMCLVNGFAGMKVYGDSIGFRPYLPEGWNGYSVTVCYRGRRIYIDVKGNTTKYRVLSGEALEISHYGKKAVISRDETELENCDS